MTIGKSKVHYAWIVLVGCCLMMFYGNGLASNIFSIFKPELAEYLSLNESQASSIFSLFCLTPLISIPIANSLYKKGIVRPFVLLCGFCLGGGYVIMGLAKNLLVCYLGAFVSGFGMMAGVVLPISIMLTNWFVKDRGLAFGIMAASSAIANFFFAPLANSNIQHFGLQNALFIHGGFIILLGIVVFIIIRRAPEDKGLLPYGVTEEDRLQTEAETSAKPAEPAKPAKPAGTPLKVLLKTGTFWKFAIAALVAGGTLGSYMTHLPSIMIFHGYTSTFASFVFSLFGVSMLVGKIIYGKLTDILGEYRATVIMFSFWCAGNLAMILIGRLGAAPYMTVLIAGMGSGLGAMGPSLWCNRLFSKEDYSTALSAANMLQQAGTALIAFIMGFFFDITGGYDAGILIYFSLIAIAMMCIISCFRKTNKQSIKE